MPLADFLRWLMAAERSRWQPMLWGLALFAAGVGAAIMLQPSPVSLLLLMLALVAWFVGGCAMVGYVRWFFANEIAEARRNAAGKKDQ
jgi:hypothetical protein